MKVKIYPKEWDEKTIPEATIPPSKSMAHRAILCAALAQGTSTLRNLADSDDILATIEGLRQLGAHIERRSDTVIVQGVSGLSCVQSRTVDCKESGSTLRFFIPVFTLPGKEMTFVGRNRLMKRPQGVYEKIYRDQGLRFEQNGDSLLVEGSLHPGNYEVDGNISSQFISGLLFALPLLDGDSTISIRPPLESRSYLELTLQMLEQFGVTASFTGENTIRIPGNQQYRPCDYTVEGDFSQMAFFAVLGAIHGDLLCKGICPASRQGDKAILDLLRRSGAVIESREDGFLVRKSRLSGIEIDLADCPDLGPILMILAMYAKGRTRIYHAARLRYKESDRIAAMEAELRKFGVDIHSSEDEILITGKDAYACHEDIWGHTDHRIVMSMAVAAACGGQPVVMDGAQAVQKSYPNFFEDFQKAGVAVEVLEP